MQRSKATFSALVLAVGLVAGLSACTSTTTVSRAEMEKQAATALASNFKGHLASVTCPGDLKATADATMHCLVTADDGSTIGVTASVTSIDGTTVNLAYKVDDKITSGPTAS
jgi:hypothetical protein